LSRLEKARKTSQRKYNLSCSRRVAHTASLCHVAYFKEAQDPTIALTRTARSGIGPVYLCYTCTILSLSPYSRKRNTAYNLHPLEVYTRRIIEDGKVNARDAGKRWHPSQSRLCGVAGVGAGNFYYSSCVLEYISLVLSKKTGIACVIRICYNKMLFKSYE